MAFNNSFTIGRTVNLWNSFEFSPIDSSQKSALASQAFKLSSCEDVLSKQLSSIEYNSQGLPVDLWLILINIFNGTSFWLPMHDKSTFSITWQPLASQILSNSICLFPFSAIPWESMIIKSGFLLKIVCKETLQRVVSLLKYSSVPYRLCSKFPVCNIKALFFNEPICAILSIDGIPAVQSITIPLIWYSSFSGTVV